MLGFILMATNLPDKIYRTGKEEVAEMFLSIGVTPDQVDARLTDIYAQMLEKNSV